MNRFRLPRLSVFRRSGEPLRVTIGPDGVTLSWTARPNGGAGGVVTLDFRETAPEALLEEPERYGTRLAERLRAAGARSTVAVLKLPLDWTSALRAERPVGLPEGDTAAFLDLQAERAAPFGGAGWRLAPPPPPLPGAAADALLVAAVLPEPRWLALQRFAAAAGLRWVSVQTDAPAAMADDAPLALELTPFGDRVIVAARARGRLIEWGSLPAATTADRAQLAAGLRVFARALPAPAGAPRTLRWRGQPPPELAGAVEAWRTADGWPEPAAAADAGGSAFEFVRPTAAAAPHWLRAVRAHLPARGRRALLAAAALLVLVVLARGVIETVLRRQAHALSPTAKESAELQRRLRHYRAWLEPVRPGAAALEALARAFPEDGRVWARRVELRDGRKIVCTGLARSAAEAVALMERLRRTAGLQELQTQYLRGGDPVQFAFEFEWSPAP